MSSLLGMRCRECGESYPAGPLSACEYCFGPLDMDYDMDALRVDSPRDRIEHGPATMWRYRDLLPLDGTPTAGIQTGGTPLIRALNLGRRLGLRNLWIKNDGVNSPTLSVKDRAVSVAVSRAREMGLKVVACASTGNLAGSVAAQAAQAGLAAYVFLPADINPSKIMGIRVYGARVVAVTGTYDDVNRLCAEVAANYPWGFVNVNLRPYYSQGAKTFGYEVAEQLGWRAPDHIVVPVGGGLLLNRIDTAFRELAEIGLIPQSTTKIHGAQSSGCSPVSTAVRNGWEMIRPQTPHTIDKSIAVGNPAEGYYAVRTIVKSGGTADEASDEELITGIRLLAETEGIFTETSGGITVAVTRKLVERGCFQEDDCVVIAVTGQGAKSTEVVSPEFLPPPVIDPYLAAVDRIAGEGIGRLAWKEMDANS